MLGLHESLSRLGVIASKVLSKSSILDFWLNCKCSTAMHWYIFLHQNYARIQSSFCQIFELFSRFLISHQISAPPTYNLRTWRSQVMKNELSTVTGEASIRNNDIVTKMGVGGSGKIEVNESQIIIPMTLNTRSTLNRAPAWLALGLQESLWESFQNLESLLQNLKKPTFRHFR